MKLNLTQHFWLCWFITLLLLFVISLSTITISPRVWMDEVQIVDYGRTIFDRDTDWSINWLVSENRPMILIVYVGSILQNFAYQLFKSPLGPRLASSIGAMFAATFCVGFLTSLKTPKWISFVLGLVFFLDPIFVSSYRGARVDCWSIALCFLVCWIIRHQINVIELNIEFNSYNQKLHKLPFLLTGICVGIMLFTWPTAIFLIPLVFTELLQLSHLCQRHQNQTTFDWSTFNNLIIITLFGFTVALFVITLPILPELASGVQRILAFSRSDSLTFNFIDKMKSDSRQFITSLFLSPFLLLGGVTIALFFRDKLKSFVTLLVLSLIILSRPYGQRLVYLIPYLVTTIALLFISNESSTQKIGYKPKQIFVAILLIWSIAISVCVRNIVAITQAQGRNPERIFQALEKTVGKGEYKIFTPYELYYAGRKLGWKVYHPFDYIKIPSNDEYKRFLLQMDYIVTVNNEVVNLVSDDFISKGQINFPVIDEQNRFFFGGRPFPVYVLYERRKRYDNFSFSEGKKLR